MMKNYLKKHVFSFLSLLALLVSYGSSQAQCTISGDSVVCENESVTYITPMTGAVYQWNAYPGVVAGAGNNATVSWTGTGTGLVTLVVKDAFGTVLCSTAKSINIYEAPAPFIIPSFIAG